MCGSTNFQYKFKAEFNNLYSLLKRESFKWDSLDTGKPELLPINPGITLQDLISEWLNGNQYYSNILRLFNKLILSFSELPAESQKKFIEDSLKIFIKSGGNQPLNFIGQLLALNYFLSATDLELFSMTAPAENAYDTEFILLDAEANSKILTKVINIHLDNLDIQTASDLTSILVTEVNSSNLNKTRGIESLLSSKSVIVLWAPLNKLKKIWKLFIGENSFNKLYDLNEILSWYILKSNDSTLLKFGPITKIFPIT